MDLIIEAIGLGAVLVLMIGPVFFALLHTAIGKGKKMGFAMAAGILVSDTTLIIACVLGLSTIIDNHLEIVRYVGSAIFISFGVGAIINGGKMSAVVVSQKKDNVILHFFKGFLINCTNPFVIIFWLGTVGMVTSRYPIKGDTFLFFLIMLSVTASGDILKVLLSSRLRIWINPRFIIWAGRVVGVILVLVGLRFLTVNLEAHL